MSVLRQLNALGQMRLDVPMLRSLDLSVAGDFDLLAGNVIAGLQPLVVSGFNVLTANAVGSAATALKLNVQGGVLLHPLASESGSMFISASDRTTELLSFSSNPRVVGAFTAGTINFIGIDLKRAPDSTTSDMVMFLDAVSLVEKSRSVPLGSTLDYQIFISTSDFSATPALCPIAKVVTDANNIVTELIDARPLLYRLGSGGSDPQPTASYSWPAGRKENTAPGTDVFAGGDKSLVSFKAWSSALMTRLWEVGGGEYWYSPTADRNVLMIRTGTTFSNGEYFEWVAVTNLHWKGIGFLLENSTATINEVADQTADSVGLTDLADGQCVYVDLDRANNRLRSGSPLIPQKGPLSALGSSTIPGSRYILAWRSGTSIYTRGSWYALGTSFAVATDAALGVVKLSSVSPTPASPTVIPGNAAGKGISAGLTPPAAGTELRIENFAATSYLRTNVVGNTTWWDLVGNLLMNTSVGLASGANLYFDSTLGTIGTNSLSYVSGSSEYRLQAGATSVGKGLKIGEIRIVRDDAGPFGLKWYDSAHSAFRSPLQYFNLAGADFVGPNNTFGAYNDIYVNADTGKLLQNGGTPEVSAPVHLPNGAKVLGIGARMTVGAAGTTTVEFRSVDKATDVATAHANATVSVTGGPVTSTVYKNGAGGNTKPVESTTSVKTIDKDAEYYIVKAVVNNAGAAVLWVTVYYIMPELAL